MFARIKDLRREKKLMEKREKKTQNGCRSMPQILAKM